MLNLNPLTIPVIATPETPPATGMKYLYLKAGTNQLVTLDSSGNEEVITSNQFTTDIKLTESFAIAQVLSDSTIRMSNTDANLFTINQVALIEGSQLGINDGYYTINTLEEVPATDPGLDSSSATDLLITFDQKRLEDISPQGQLHIAKPIEIIHNLGTQQVLLQPDVFSKGSVSIRIESAVIDENSILLMPDIPLTGDFSINIIGGISKTSFSEVT